MLVINPKLNIPITILDNDTGKSWDMFFYYKESGRVALAFDCPNNIRITNAKKAERKEIDNEPQRKF